MNQITQMFMESNTRMKQVMAGDFKAEQIAAAQREFEGQIKLINAVISAFGIASKNKRALVGLERMNLMDDSTAVDLLLGDPEVDKVKCPEQDHLITRGECLDYSGNPKHFDICEGCEIGKTNKDKLIPLPKK
jgi:hypothetical protein